jgi:hypothetical protein
VGSLWVLMIRFPAYHEDHALRFTRSTTHAVVCR